MEGTGGRKAAPAFPRGDGFALRHFRHLAVMPWPSVREKSRQQVLSATACSPHDESKAIAPAWVSFSVTAEPGVLGASLWPERLAIPQGGIIAKPEQALHLAE
jgi:hypothetical protein